MLMYSLIVGLLISENEQKRPQTDDRLSSKFLGRRINPCLNSSSSSSLLDEDIIEVLKYPFYKSYVKLTSDLPLVVCTCSLQNCKWFEPRSHIIIR